MAQQETHKTTEIAKFRLMRAPQRLTCRDMVPLQPSEAVRAWFGEGSDRVTAAVNWLRLAGLASPTIQVPGPDGSYNDELLAGLSKLRHVEQAVIRAGNQLAPDRLLDAVSQGSTGPKRDQLLKYWQLETTGVRQWLDDTLIAVALGGMQTPVEPALVSDLTRLRLIQAVALRLIDDATALADSVAVGNALRWTRLVLPALMRPAPFGPVSTVFRVGVTDLYSVRQEWTRFEAGELAHIENVMAFEKKERQHTRLDEKEDIVTAENEQARYEERDSQTTDRFELSEQAQKETELALAIDATVDTTGQYGPTNVDTHVGGSLDFSQHDAEQRATNIVRESVTRAVTRAEQRTLERRQTRKLQRIEEINRHALHNTSDTPVAGLYRWVDKVLTLQIVRFPNRLLLEFQLPEPGAWLRWWLANRRGSGMSNPKPIPFTTDGKESNFPTGGGAATNALKPSDISSNTLSELVARYGVEGLTPYPQNLVIGTTLLEKTADSPTSDRQPIDYYEKSQLTVPQGYKAVSWTAQAFSWQNRATFPNSNASVAISVGGSSASVGWLAFRPGTPAANREGLSGAMSGNVGDIAQGTIPIAIQTDATRGYAVAMNIVCEPTGETIEKWRISTYERLLGAFNDQLRRYEDERAARALATGGLEGALPTARGQELMREELKRQVIEQIMGARFDGLDGMDFVGTLKEPSARPSDIIDHGRVVQFFEQAFEWENMTFICYPHYWAPRAAWGELAGLAGADPEFGRFLRSGSARVVVSARPTFSDHVLFFLQYRQLWSGGPVPAPDDPNYLSVAEEIRLQTEMADDGEPGASWEVRLPTTLVWLDPAGAMPVTNASARLPLQLPRP